MLKGILLKIGLKRVCFKKLIEPPLFKSGLVKALKNLIFGKVSLLQMEQKGAKRLWQALVTLSSMTPLL